MIENFPPEFIKFIDLRIQIQSITQRLILVISDFMNGGGTQTRTGGKGFAVLCLTTWLYRPE